MRMVLATLCAALAAGGCGRGDGAPGGGEVVIGWQGDDKQGGAVLPARATFCRETGLLELVAVRGDTGFGIALFPPDSARPPPITLDYRVFHAGTDPEPRPGANVAVRWLDQIALEAYEGIGGSVRLETAPPGLVSGTVDAALQAAERSDTLRVTARFREVLLDTAGAGCGTLHRRNRL